MGCRMRAEQAVGDERLVRLGGHGHAPVLAHARPALDGRAERQEPDDRGDHAERRVPRQPREIREAERRALPRRAPARGSVIHATASGTQSVHITRSRRCSGMTPTTLCVCLRTRTIIVPMPSQYATTVAAMITPAMSMTHCTGAHTGTAASRCNRWNVRRYPIVVARARDLRSRIAAMVGSSPSGRLQPDAQRAGACPRLRSRGRPGDPARAVRPVPRQAHGAPAGVRRADRRPLREPQPHSRRRHGSVQETSERSGSRSSTRRCATYSSGASSRACAARDAGPTRRRRSPRCAC